MSQPGNHHDPRIYFIEAPGLNLVKIGWSTCIENRIEGIRKSELDGMLSRVDLRLLGSIPGDYFGEQVLHRHFAIFRVRGEWFLADEARPFIEDICKLTDEQVAAWFAYHRRKLEPTPEMIGRREKHFAEVDARRARKRRQKRAA